MIRIAVLFIPIFANLPCRDAAVMEVQILESIKMPTILDEEREYLSDHLVATFKSMIHIDSDNFKVTSFLERFKKFIARSHGENSLVQNDENPWAHKLIHFNDTFQANYDFSKNLLTMTSSYSLLLNGTERKISDVKITVNFRFNQETHQKIILEDIHGSNVIPNIEHERNWQCDSEYSDLENEDCKSENNKGSTILGKLLSPIVNVVEPIIVAFIHIVVNGILGHVLATAFDQLYNGRLITV